MKELLRRHHSARRSWASIVRRRPFSHKQKHYGRSRKQQRKSYTHALNTTRKCAERKWTWLKLVESENTIMILFGQPSLVQILLIKWKQLMGREGEGGRNSLCFYMWRREGVVENDCAITFNYNVITILFADRLPEFVFLFLIVSLDLGINRL